MRITCGIVCTFLLLVSACAEPDVPDLCLFRSDSQNGAASAEKDCAAIANESLKIASGQPYYIRHELPEGIEPPESLEVHIATPCGESSFQASHAKLDEETKGKYIVLVSKIAPRGAACSLIVTATIANSELRESAHPDAEACATIEQECSP